MANAFLKGWWLHDSGQESWGVKEHSYLSLGAYNLVCTGSTWCQCTGCVGQGRVESLSSMELLSFGHVKSSSAKSTVWELIPRFLRATRAGRGITCISAYRIIDVLCRDLIMYKGCASLVSRAQAGEQWASQGGNRSLTRKLIQLRLFILGQPLYAL